MVYNMLSVHPETCQSYEQPRSAAKSQEVGSQQKKKKKKMTLQGDTRL